jgi:hypothetical protein
MITDMSLPQWLEDRRDYPDGILTEALSALIHVYADILIEYVKAWEKMGLFDSTLEELQKRNAKRSIELLTKAMNITREPKQITLEVFQ